MSNFSYFIHNGECGIMEKIEKLLRNVVCAFWDFYTFLFFWMRMSLFSRRLCWIWIYGMISLFKYTRHKYTYILQPIKLFSSLHGRRKDVTFLNKQQWACFFFFCLFRRRQIVLAGKQMYCFVLNIVQLFRNILGIR